MRYGMTCVICLSKIKKYMSLQRFDSIDRFFDAENRGAYRYSIHPLYAISSKATSYLDLGKACFTIEGSDAHLAELKALFSEMGNTVVAISPDSKALYHAAAVMVSNQIVALADMGTALLVKCGFSEAAAAEALSPLLLGNAQSVAEKGAVNALTGPIERGDAQTVSADGRRYGNLQWKAL